ncbi:2-dehydro-3-deoxygalactonokinase [Sulfitobacter sp. LCG007]
MTRSDIGSTAWVAADWGSTNLRLWLMSAGDTVIDRISDPRGAARLTAGAFEPVLRDLLAPAMAQPRETLLQVVACGMVGARQGWGEAAYLTVPTAPVCASKALIAPAGGSDLVVHILPGLQQSAPPDVMRGEETQIAGLLATDHGFNGIVCLPGTHSKWARVTRGKVQSFTTCMTGELFALLSENSVLRHSVGADALDRDVFEAAARESLVRPETLSTLLFGIRAGALLAGTGPDQGKARLSGLLIGAEIGAMRAVLADHPIAVIGEKAVSDSYLRVLRAAGLTATRIDAQDATLRGLSAAHHALKGQTV